MEKMELALEAYNKIAAEIESACDRDPEDFRDDFDRQSFGCHEVELEMETLPVEVGGMEYIFTFPCTCEVEVTDDSFSHEFGIEYLTSCHFRRILDVGPMTAYDEYGDEYEVIFDKDKF